MLRQKSHQTLKKVTNDFAERNSFNTAIASVMELLNAVPESFKKDEANDAQQFCLDEVIRFTLKMLLSYNASYLSLLVERIFRF